MSASVLDRKVENSPPEGAYALQTLDMVQLRPQEMLFMHILATYSTHNPRLGRLLVHSPYAHIRRSEQRDAPNRTHTTCHVHHLMTHRDCSHARPRSVPNRPGTPERDLQRGPSRHMPTAARHTHMPRACIARVACQAHGGDRVSRADDSEALKLLLDDEVDERLDLDVQRARRARRRG